MQSNEATQSQLALEAECLSEGIRKYRNLLAENGHRNLPPGEQLPEATNLSPEQLALIPKKNAANAAAAYLRIFNDLIGKQYMPPQMVQILLAVYTHENLPLTQLDLMLPSSSGAISRNVQKLGVGTRPADPDVAPGLGLVESYEDPMDRRTTLVKLTPRGKNLLDQIHGRAYLAMERYFSNHEAPQS